ncbi:carboxypeptidase-like regulatory domain-containing protein [Streptomyces sp. ME02-8801-2C]|uniref:carboxypeptidase-like regulatory domain-containing protein n=1 Tax=Streptomyces sp. ME02-8801-2C TaxID=3028680 RepID=UPI0029B9D98D|nr:carboxypeptidase-like regulatory domain-containing protein [Streptomyces sp. ME02-8801-2C]MDX3458587.1 carboxypeptidase-like regulatory domain-containing protein [Streptomyces sp. ME02-8801-2C]
MGELEANNDVYPVWSTFFLLSPPGHWPMNSGDKVSLVSPDDRWAPSANKVRVEHGGRRKEDIEYYVMGGPNTWVWAAPAGAPNFTSGLPGYAQDTDPFEWEFTLEKAGGGTIDDGDHVSIRIGQRRIDEGPYYFRVSDSGDGATIFGDGLAPFESDSTFIISSAEVRNVLGPRPEGEIDCQLCGTVTGTVTDTHGQPVADVTVTAEPGPQDAGAPAPIADHPVSATTDADGNYRLRDAEGRDCIAPGQITLTFTSDRHQTFSRAALVPGEGGVTKDIRLACTVVQGKVVENIGGNDVPVPGVEVTLTYTDTAVSLIAVSDPITGEFVFECVRHTVATLATESTSPQSVLTIASVSRPIPDTGVRDIIIRIPSPGQCPVVSGIVTDAMTGAALEGAKVTVLNTTPAGVLHTDTDAQGRYSIQMCGLNGNWSLKAGKTRYESLTQPTGALPVTGTVTVNFALRPLVPPGTPPTIDCTLFWGKQPAQLGQPPQQDLDSHLSGPDGSGAADSRFHCYYGRPAPVTFVELDRDDTDWEGPEHIVVKEFMLAGQPTIVPGEYHYWVRNFSGESGLTSSGGRVSVLVDGRLEHQFYASKALGDSTKRGWRVFDFRVTADGSVTIRQLEFNGVPAPDGYFVDAADSEDL